MSNNDLRSRRVTVLTAVDTLNFPTTPACRDAVAHVVSRMITEEYNLASFKMSEVMHSAAEELGITYDGLKGRLRSFKNHFYQRLPIHRTEQLLGTKFNPEKQLNNEQFYTCIARYVISEHKLMLEERRDRLEQEKRAKIGYIIRPLGTSIEADWELSSIIIDALNTMIEFDGTVHDIDYDSAFVKVQRDVQNASELKLCIKFYQKFMFKNCTKDQLRYIFKKFTRLPMNLDKFMRLLAEHVVDVW